MTSNPGFSHLIHPNTEKTNTPWMILVIHGVFVFPGCGTPSGARTLDTLIKSQVLYQLS